MDAKVWAHEVRAFTRYKSADGTVGATNSTAGIVFKNGLYVSGSLNTAGLPLSTDNITILGESGEGYLAFGSQGDDAPVLGLAHIFSDGGRKINLGASGSTLHNIAFDNQLLSASRIYTAPNKSGIFAMTNDNVSQFTNDSGYITPVALANYVQGPAGSLTGSLPSFSNTTGKFLQDSGIGAATVVVGPGSAVSANIPSFSGTSGKLIQDSGVAIGSVVIGPASAVSGQIPMFSGTTGKLIADSGVGITGGGIISLGGFNFVVPATGTAVLTSRGLTAGAGLTGGGDLGADRSFAVGAGAGLTVNADDVALTTPGTIAIATGNVSAGSHTHAITSSANPGVAASLLATDASGDVILQNLSLGGTQFLPVTTFRTDIGQMTKKFKEIHGAELHIETLVLQESLATVGGRILVGPTTSLIADALAAATTIDVKHNNLANGDQTYFEDDGKVEFMAVTSGATVITDGYRYSVTRNLDGTGANDWYAGDAAFNTGQTGSGFIDLYSIRGVKSASEEGPTIVGNIRQSATYNDWKAAWAIGNLNGLYGYSADTFGVGLGIDGSTDFITVEPVNGLIIRGGGGNISLNSAGLTILSPTVYNVARNLRWTQSGSTVAELSSVYTGAAPFGGGIVRLTSRQRASDTTNSGSTIIEAFNDQGSSTLLALYSFGSVQSGGNDGFVVITSNIAPGSGYVFRGVHIGGPGQPAHMLDIDGEGWFQTGIALRDTSAAFDVNIRATSSVALAANRILTLDVANAARTLKLTGNPTLADWFDQSVKVAATPTFAGATLNGPIAKAFNTNLAEFGDANWTFGNASNGSSIYWMEVKYFDDAGTTRGFRVKDSSSGNAVFSTNLQETIISSKVKIGAGTPVLGGDIGVARAGGTTGVIFLNTAADRYLFYDGTNYILPGASLVVNGTTYTSSRKLKKNIRSWKPSKRGGIHKLNPRIFDRIDSGARNEVGFVAEEVRKVLPEAVSDCVSDANKPNAKKKPGINMMALVTALIYEVQQQRRELDALIKV